MSTFKAPVPARFKDIRFKDLLASNEPSMLNSVAQCDKWLDAYVAGDNYGQGIMFWGPPGAGKTIAVSAMMNEATARGLKMGFITLTKYEKLLRDKMTTQSQWEKMQDQSAYERWVRLDGFLRWLEKIDVAILDDLGQEHSGKTRWMEDELQYLLRNRFDVGKPTILTTNLDPNQIKDVYGHVQASFFTEALVSIKVDAPDYRAILARDRR